jgi:hypothetical protein
MTKLFEAEDKEADNVREAFQQFVVAPGLLSGQLSSMVLCQRDLYDKALQQLDFRRPNDVVFIGAEDCRTARWIEMLCGKAVPQRSAHALPRSFEHHDDDCTRIGLELIDERGRATTLEESSVIPAGPDPEQMLAAVRDRITEIESKANTRSFGARRLVRIQAPLPQLKRLNARIIDTAGLLE